MKCSHYNKNKVLKRIIEQIENCEYRHAHIARACRELPLAREELVSQPIGAFQDHSHSKGLEQLRLEHYEARRTAKLVLVANFLIEHNLTLDCERPRPQTASCPTGKTGPLDPTPLSTELHTGKIQSEKEKIRKQLKFKEKLRQLQLDEAQKITVKWDRREAHREEERKKQELRQKQFKQRDERIQFTLKRKHSEVRDRELAQLKEQYARTPRRTRTVKSVLNSPSKHFIKRLQEIEQKLSKSGERRQTQLRQRALGGHFEISTQDVEKRRNSLQTEYEEQLVKCVLRMQEKRELSQQRRRETTERENRKLNQQFGLWEERKKRETEKQWKQRELQEERANSKSSRIEWVKADLKNKRQQQSLAITKGNNLKKHRVEANLLRNRRRQEKMRENILERQRNAGERLLRTRTMEEEVKRATANLYSELVLGSSF